MAFLNDIIRRIPRTRIGTHGPGIPLYNGHYVTWSVGLWKKPHKCWALWPGDGNHGMEGTWIMVEEPSMRNILDYRQPDFFLHTIIMERIFIWRRTDNTDVNETNGGIWGCSLIFWAQTMWSLLCFFPFMNLKIQIMSAQNPKLFTHACTPHHSKLPMVVHRPQHLVAHLRYKWWPLKALQCVSRWWH